MTIAILWSLLAEYWVYHIIDSGVLWPYMVAPSSEMNILVVIIRWQSVPGMKLLPAQSRLTSFPRPPPTGGLLIAYSTQNCKQSTTEFFHVTCSNSLPLFMKQQTHVNLVEELHVVMPTGFWLNTVCNRVFFIWHHHLALTPYPCFRNSKVVWIRLKNHMLPCLLAFDCLQYTSFHYPFKPATYLWLIYSC